MILNLVHRAALTDTYRFQQKCAHDLKLKTTVYISSSLLKNEKVISMVKADQEKYGDEVGIWIDRLPGMPSTMVWLLSEADKMKTVKYSIDKYKEVFGHAPKAVSNYVLDAHLIRMIKEYCPEVTICVAGCFEEGVKVFHGCNNSWYLFSEGMSWNPWYPSKTQSIRPAENEEDWAGVVAVPHLSRDLVLAYEGRNDFFASHPANVQRGLANEGMIHEYDYNLADQYRMQGDYNDGFSYYQIHVSSGWLHHNHNIIDCDEITYTLYRDTLEYMAKLRDEGEVVDMYMSEFAEYYKKTVPIGKADIAVGKDILYGSGKHYFWITNPDYRVLIDAFQGGSIGDLRPYAGKYESFTGTDSESLTMNSYPYIIQSQYRTGVKNHFQDGSRTTVFVKHNGEEKDMCMYPSKVAAVRRDNGEVELDLTPVKIAFSDGFTVKIQTNYMFSGKGRITVARRILEKSEANAELQFTEYVKGCYGFTEYPENMKDIVLASDNGEKLYYGYTDKTLAAEGGKTVTVSIPQITTEVELCAVNVEPDRAEVSDGSLFSPYYTMKLHYTLKNEEEVKTCLTVRKMKV
ncbi:MAG: hypothetical protein IJZ34_07225 [Lachnospiraceae bacterium]|nr:hypothetical protein [Lachnospiraceae bacterium]